MVDNRYEKRGRAAQRQDFGFPKDGVAVVVTNTIPLYYKVLGGIVAFVGASVVYSVIRHLPIW